MNALTYINQHDPKPYLERWQRSAHIAACRKPYAGSERAIWSLITSLASMIDQHDALARNEAQCICERSERPEPRFRLGDDGYYYEHIKALFRAARAYLNFSVGRFDCGTLDRLILDLAGMAGLREDDV